MDERKTYLNTDELQADDELSPLPSMGRQRRQTKAKRQGPEADPQVPPPAATSE